MLDLKLNALKIIKAETPNDIDTIRSLFLEYAAAIGIDLGFQGFVEELKSLPGKYSPPEGELLLLFFEDKPAGCIALRKLDAGICEMKRLYVKPEFRGYKIGRKLAEVIITEAKNRGYDLMRLDTLSSMTEARNLYKSLGFYEIEPYYYNPVENPVFMELRLK